MAHDIQEAINSIDLDQLSEVARQSLGVEILELLDWEASPIHHEKSIETTGGLIRFTGHGKAGISVQPWSAVLKIITRPDTDCDEPGGLCYWRREMLAYQTGLLAQMPSAVRAPRCYGVTERADGGWIWMEDLHEMARTVWGMAEYQRAARHLGRWAGAYLTGRPVPSQDWLCRSLFRGLYADGDWWAKFTNPKSPNNAWQRPLVQRVFSEPLRDRVLQVWADKWQFISANERLPQVFCHNDAHRRNLMLSQDAGGQDNLTAIDWGFCGLGALGNDLGELIGTSLSYFAIDSADAVDLEAAALEGYQAGLRDAGWSGDGKQARMGYLIALGLYWGGTLPCEVAQVQPGEARVNAEAKYGKPVEVLLPGWTRLAEFALDRADEARYWMAGKSSL